MFLAPFVAVSLNIENVRILIKTLICSLRNTEPQFSLLHLSDLQLKFVLTKGQHSGKGRFKKDKALETE